MFEKLINIEQCPPGASLFVSCGDKQLAVFHLQSPDRFIVCENACPHAGGDLSAGLLGRNTITCPVHHWKFDLNTGYCVGNDDAVVRRYTCKVKDNDLLVDLTRPLTIPPPPRYGF